MLHHNWRNILCVLDIQDNQNHNYNDADKWLMDANTNKGVTQTIIRMHSIFISLIERPLMTLFRMFLMLGTPCPSKSAGLVNKNVHGS